MLVDAGLLLVQKPGIHLTPYQALSQAPIDSNRELAMQWLLVHYPSLFEENSGSSKASWSLCRMNCVNSAFAVQWEVTV